jgi:hypothetical protein
MNLKDYCGLGDAVTAVGPDGFCFRAEVLWVRSRTRSDETTWEDGETQDFAAASRGNHP